MAMAAAEQEQELMRELGGAPASLGLFSRTTAMCWAASTGGLDAMRRLREHGADVNAADYDKRCVNACVRVDGSRAL
jgi:hypothetical protein